MLHAVIMAGGSGTRFWPASRQNLPKQLLNLAGQQTMIQATCRRLGDLAPAERVLIVTNRRLVDAIRRQLPELPPGAVLGEPCKRDTAPCVGLAAVLIRNQDPDGVMAVMPADHVIGPDEVFQAALRRAYQLVLDDPSRIVTFGVKPSYPAESFGYIQRGSALTESGAYQVERFREKPDAATAKRFVESGDFYWNSGIFVWSIATILEALERWEPEMYARLQTIGGAADSADFAEVLEREFTAIQGKSIDYAVMEHYPNTIVLEAPFQWDDLGSWGALPRLLQADAQGNAASGRHLLIDAANCIVRSNDEHLVALLGMKDCIVVHTDDATLVAHRDDEESVRKIVAALAERGWENHL